MYGKGKGFSISNVLAFTAGTIIASQIVERFVLQRETEDGMMMGFVPVGGGPFGIGLDDVARGVATLGGVMVASKVLGRML